MSAIARVWPKTFLLVSHRKQLAAVDKKRLQPLT